MQALENAGTDDNVPKEEIWTTVGTDANKLGESWVTNNRSFREPWDDQTRECVDHFLATFWDLFAAQNLVRLGEAGEKSSTLFPDTDDAFHHFIARSYLRNVVEACTEVACGMDLSLDTRQMMMSRLGELDEWQSSLADSALEVKATQQTEGLAPRGMKSADHSLFTQHGQPALLSHMLSWFDIVKRQRARQEAEFNYEVHAKLMSSPEKLARSVVGMVKLALSYDDDAAKRFQEAVVKELSSQGLSSLSLQINPKQHLLEFDGDSESVGSASEHSAPAHSATEYPASEYPASEHSASEHWASEL